MIEVRKSQLGGVGVFAATDIQKGATIAEWDGRLLDFDDPEWDVYEKNDHAMQVAPRTWITSIGPAKLLNHSCDPNAVNEFGDEIRIVAAKDIRAGEEITWDYDTTERPFWYRLKCVCGSANCRGVIGTRTLTDGGADPLWMRYCIPEHITRRR